MHEGEEYSHNGTESTVANFVSFNGMSRLNEDISGRTMVSQAIVTTNHNDPSVVDFYLYPTGNSIVDSMIIRFPVNFISNVLEMASGGVITHAPQAEWNL